MGCQYFELMARFATVLRERPRLDARARRILYALTTEYVATGEPVGSRRLANRYGIDLSPATIRNVLADLEDAGLVMQPHTSAGRIPTNLGFRVFVDALVQMRELSEEDRQTIAQRMMGLRDDPDPLREAGKVLSALTGSAAVVRLPRPREERLSQIRFMTLRSDELLAVMITESGQIENRIVRSNRLLDPSELERIHNYLETLVTGRTLLEARDHIAREMEAERGTYQELRKHAMDVLDAAMSGQVPSERIVIEGQSLLFNRPEFSEGHKIRQFVKAFEDKQQLLELLERTMMSGGVHVALGAEAQMADLNDVGLVSASYDGPNNAAGALAVVGLMRMDYGRVVPLVRFAAEALSASLREEEIPEREEELPASDEED